jgi:hypothetical protein
VEFDVVSIIPGFLLKTCKHFCFLPCVPHAPPMMSCLLWIP